MLVPLAAEVVESTGARELELEAELERAGSEEGVEEGERSFLSARRLDPGIVLVLVLYYTVSARGERIRWEE